jgi:hypothetical protein
VYAILGKILTGKKKRVAVLGVHNVPIDFYMSREDYYFPGINNSLSMKQQFQIEYDCHFDLQKYPFDQQLCKLGLDIKGKDDERFVLSADANDAVSYTGSEDVGDFNIIEVINNLTRCLGNNDKKESSTPEFILCIVIKRSHADQIVSIFCPSILFWILAYFTMFLKIGDIANRSRTSVTLLLVLIALLQGVKKDFPKTTYYKYIDIWFLWYVFNIFLISLYHMILPSFHLSGGKESNPGEKKEDAEAHAWKEENKGNLVVNRVEKINFALSVFFPVVMFIFNVIYFYLTI